MFELRSNSPWEGPRFYCDQRKHTYRLFLDLADPYKQVWVGRLFKHEVGLGVDGYGWYTCEAEVGITHIEVGNVRIVILPPSSLSPESIDRAIEEFKALKEAFE